MNKLMMLLATALIAGCAYKVPLTEEHTIPVDKELLGLWVDAQDVGKDGREQEWIIVMEFSKTEYVVCWHTKEGPFHLRGYPVKMGAISCVQLQFLGVSDEKQDEENRFAVAKYEIKNNLLKVSLLNDEVVSGKIETSEALRDAFLGNITNQDLFDKHSSYRRDRETNE